MTPLTATDMQRLEHDARGLATEEGGRQYLAEALGCLQDTGDPLDVLQLLRAMWPGGSQQQQQAINAVGQWIVRRIQRTPVIAAEDLARELGWLRRMVQCHEKAAREQKREQKAHTRPPPARSRKSVNEPDFAQILPALCRHRDAALDEQSRTAARQRNAEQAAAAVPVRLPDVFAVDFADIQAVRDARKAARKRAKQGKPAKDRLLPLRPMDAQLVPLCANLVCSLLHTENLDAIFEAMDAAGGVSPPFYIASTDIEDQADGQTTSASFAASPSIRTHAEAKAAQKVLLVRCQPET